MKILFVIGTRPEAIKLAPLVYQFSQNKSTSSCVCVTGQHRKMLDQVLEIFNIKADYDLNLMTKNQTLGDITAKCIKELTVIIQNEQPDMVIIQGDTTSAFSGALASFYNKIPIGHVEAGLRTNNMYSPWPEEGNRKLISVLSNMNFVPTKSAEENLLKEGADHKSIYITGNTVIDALISIEKKITTDKKMKTQLSDWFSKICPYALEIKEKEKKLILITGHRRESFGYKMKSIFTAIRNLAKQYPELVFLFPVHLNPIVMDMVNSILKGLDNIILTEPVEYTQMVYLMKEAYIIITDSGGIQEEAPSLGTPVLVTRIESERPEGIEAGCSRLVGFKEKIIMSNFIEILENKNIYTSMLVNSNPYGDGTSCQKIFNHITNKLKSTK